VDPPPPRGSPERALPADAKVATPLPSHLTDGSKEIERRGRHGHPMMVRHGNAVAAYARGVYRVSMMRQHSPRRRVLLRGMGLLLLLVIGITGSALALRPSPDHPLPVTLALGPTVADVLLDGSAHRVVVGPDRDGRIYTIDLPSGTLAPTVTLQSTPSTPSPQPWNGPPSWGRLLLVDGPVGGIVAADPRAPRQLSAFTLNDGVLHRSATSGGTTPMGRAAFGFHLGPWLVLATRPARLFILSNDAPGGLIDIRDARTLRLLRTVPLEPGWPSATGFGFGSATVPLRVDDAAARVVVSHIGRPFVSVLDAASGRPLATVALAPPPTGGLYTVPALTLDPRTHLVFATTGNGGGGVVTTLDARTGRVLRVVPIAGNPSPPLLLPRTHRVMVATQTGLAVLDARSGRLVRTVSVAPAGLNALVTDDQAQVLAAVDGTGHAITLCDPTTGHLRRTLQVGDAVDTLAVDARHGRLLVVTAAPFDATRQAFTGPALLRVFDLRGGRAVGTYPLGVGFRAQLLLDPRANRLVALLDGGAAPAGPDPWGWLPAAARHHIPFLPPPPAGTTLHPASATVFDTARL